MVVVLAGLALVFSTLELFWPSTRRRPLQRKGVGTDVLYFFLAPTVTRALTFAVIAVVVPVGIVLLGQSDVAGLREHLSVRAIDGFGPVAGQPLALVVLEMLLLSELLGYFLHRRFHRSARLWKLHAVHHSSEDLDWLSSVRTHPLNTVVMRTLTATPLLLVGFPVKALAMYLPFLPLYAIFLHANVPWDFGPLRYVIASPAFHRWHHTSESEGLDKNFAGLFPFIDLMFGTFYLPRERRVESFGLRDERVPEGVLAQLAYPFEP